MPAGESVEGFRSQLFVREEEDVELVGEERRGGGVPGGVDGVEGVLGEEGGEIGDPAVWRGKGGEG